MPRFLALLFALALPLSACGPNQVEPAPDATQELPDPDPDTPLDVDPLSRDDGQSSDEAMADSVQTGDDLFNAPIEDETPPVDEPADTM